MNVSEIQAALRQEGLDGWLFFDHHQRDHLAYRVLQFEPERMCTRRWYYFIPASGEPRKLVHQIEAGMLDAIPGEKLKYSGWAAQLDGIKTITAGAKKIAMQYSANCAIPYVAMVDAGTIELVRGLGLEIVTSANLVQQFEAKWNQEKLDSHLEAGRRVDRVRQAAFDHIGSCLRGRAAITEHAVQQFILRAFEEEGLFTDHGPIVAINENASNPHYEPLRESSSFISQNDLVLIDLWAKLKAPGSVYYDVTWMGYAGEVPPDEKKRIFGIVSGARDAAVSFIKKSVAAQESICGYQVDDVTRGHIAKHGLAQFFFHRTGHSIGEEVHGTGANMDNLETHDDRRIIPWTCFSIEPGIYQPEFGVRSEVNVFVGEKEAIVTGEIQTELLLI